MKRNNKIITCTDGTQFKRVSRWLTIRNEYNIAPGHELYEVGYDDGDERCIDYVNFKGYCISTQSMYALGSMWISERPHKFIENKEEHFISAVDMDGDLYDPYYIEMDKYGEKVRLYKKS